MLRYTNNISKFSMQKILPLFLVVILIGAGCTDRNPSSSSISEPSTSTQEEQVLEKQEQEKETEKITKDSDTETGKSAIVVMEDEVEVVVEEIQEEEGVKEETIPSEEPLVVEEEPLPEEIPEEEIPALSITMKSGNFFFEPSQMTASPGQEVHLTFLENSGFHTFVIDEIALNESIETGNTISFTAPMTPGNYAYYCDVGSHRSMGMEGILIVK